MTKLRIIHSLLFAALAVSISDAGDGWPQFGGPTRNFRLEEPIQWNPHAPTKRWQTTLGQGMAGIVVDDGIAYTSYLKPFDAAEKEKPESDRTHREVIVALDADNGKARWRYEYDAGWIESQQAFGGRSRAPQATPALCGNLLICIGFTGKMHCLEKASGKLVWAIDLVHKFEATPVQFGFAASPLALRDRVIVSAGGQLGGLVCLDVATGKKLWNVPCNEASYATPVLWNRTDGEQIVMVTRNRVVGVDSQDGRALWQYPLPAQRLTNVPTPLPIDNTSLLISGQGAKGTRRLRVQQVGGQYEVTEAWESNAQFFYCNWVRWKNVLLGSGGNLLTVLDLNNGNTLGRFRGFNDANLLLRDRQVLILHGDGHLSELNVSDAQLQSIQKFAVLDERCWTPPTPNGHFLYCRGGDQILCLDLVGGDRRAAVKTSPIAKSILKLRDLKDTDASVDLAHDSKRADPIPSPKTTRAENGLLYLEFAVRNSGSTTIQAFVKGPDAHPFSYGLPIRPQQIRKEKWPVGTKLYRTKSGIRQNVLLTVQPDFAGRTVDVSDDTKAEP